jgi:hypothetical protein
VTRLWPASVVGGRFLPTWLAVVVVLSLAACAPPSSEPEQDKHRLIGDANFVIVEDAGDAAHATPAAQQHCASYGKVAHLKRLSRHHHGRYAEAVDVEFDCISPS